MVPRAVRLIATLTLSAIVLAAVAWGALAVWFDGAQSRGLGGTMAGAWQSPRRWPPKAKENKEIQSLE
jgi:hypothetical protein